MDSAMPDEKIRQRFQAALMIYVFHFPLLVLYGVIGWFYLKQKGFPVPESSSQGETLKYLLGFAALSAAAASFLIKPIVMGKPGLQTAGVLPEQKLGKLFTASTIMASFGDAIGILGLVLIFITQELPVYYPFAILGVCVLFLHLPRLEDWQRQVRP